MVDRRMHVMGTALAVVAEGGLPSLTHREVDRAGGLPLGSTANLFGTKEELLIAVIEEFERRDAVMLETFTARVPIASFDDAADLLARYVQESTGVEHGWLTRARLSLLLARPDAMKDAHARVLVLLATMFRSIGVLHPEATARCVAAYIDGNALHAVTEVAKTEASAAAVRRSILALLVSSRRT